jgi:hypothetical protein
LASGWQNPSISRFNSPGEKADFLLGTLLRFAGFLAICFTLKVETAGVNAAWWYWCHPILLRRPAFKSVHLSKNVFICATDVQIIKPDNLSRLLGSHCLSQTLTQFRLSTRAVPLSNLWNRTFWCIVFYLESEAKEIWDS